VGGWDEKIVAEQGEMATHRERDEEHCLRIHGGGGTLLVGALLIIIVSAGCGSGLRLGL
jgi:hypothetical protein